MPPAEWALASSSMCAISALPCAEFLPHVQGVDDTDVAAMGYAQLHGGVSPTAAMQVNGLCLAWHVKLEVWERQSSPQDLLVGRVPSLSRWHI